MRNVIGTAGADRRCWCRNRASRGPQRGQRQRAESGAASEHGRGDLRPRPCVSLLPRPLHRAPLL